MYILFVPHQLYAVFLLKDAKTFEALSAKAFDILRKGLSTIAELPFRKNYKI